jgi:hypothetical protein
MPDARRSPSWAGPATATPSSVAGITPWRTSERAARDARELPAARGHAPSGSAGPGGNYDGTFVQDWEYAAGTGDLDECNGRTGAVTSRAAS